MYAEISVALQRFPVVILTGARQTGKTTLVTLPPVSSERLYRSLDDYDILERARNEPDALLWDAPRLTLDEVQKAPALLSAIKRVVDQKRVAGQFLLTGSANLLMMRRISESLAGRAQYLDLWPMTESEKAGKADEGPWSALLQAKNARDAREALMKRHSEPFSEKFQRILAGGYPLSVLASGPEERSAWFDGYVRTYLERDLQDVAAISALVDFRRLMKLAALRIGQILRQAELARDAALSHPTAHRYLNLLEISFQIIRIPAYAVNRTKRLVKSPKLYWTDTGLAAHLSDLEVLENLKASPLAGALLENLLLMQLLPWRESVIPHPEIYYWRTVTGEEVDFVIEAGRRLLPIEVKSSTRVELSDAAPLEVFLNEYRENAPFGIIFHGGHEIKILTPRVLAVPLGVGFGIS